MFALDAAPKPYLVVPRRRRGWGRVVILAAALFVVCARLAYGGQVIPIETVVVGPGDTVWGIAQAHYTGDPRPHVDEILRINHLSSPILKPGQTLQIPRD